MRCANYFHMLCLYPWFWCFVHCGFYIYSLKRLMAPPVSHRAQTCQCSAIVVDKMARSIPSSARKNSPVETGILLARIYFISSIYSTLRSALYRKSKEILFVLKNILINCFIVPRCSQFLYLRAVSKNLAESTVRSTAAGCILSSEINSESKLFAHGRI